MSLVEELGARLAATGDDLPVPLVVAAIARLRRATELLDHVRRESVDPLGVPQLANAVEHLEHAAAALRLTQDAIAEYLGVLGLAVAGDPAPREAERPRPPAAGPQPPPRPSDVRPLRPEDRGPWWRRRITELTGEAPPPAEPSEETVAGRRPRETAPAAARRPATGEPPRPEVLLRRMARGVRSGDRAALGRELHAVDASTGLALTAVATPVLDRLAGDLLGHRPGPADRARLRAATAGRVRSLLPGTPPQVLDALLDRLCRTPLPERGPAPHPADTAVTAGVLAGVLLARLGRDPATLEPPAPAPDPAPTGPAAADPAAGPATAGPATGPVAGPATGPTAGPVGAGGTGAGDRGAGWVADRPVPGADGPRAPGAGAPGGPGDDREERGG